MLGLQLGLRAAVSTVPRVRVRVRAGVMYSGRDNRVGTSTDSDRAEVGVRIVLKAGHGRFSLE